MRDLGIEDAVHDHETVRRRQTRERGAVGAEQLRWGGKEALVEEALAGALETRVGERRPQALGVRDERFQVLQRFGRGRVLVVHALRADRREGRRILARPSGLPAVDQVLDVHSPRAAGCGISRFASPATGEDASA